MAGKKETKKTFFASPSAFCNCHFLDFQCRAFILFPCVQTQTTGMCSPPKTSVIIRGNTKQEPSFHMSSYSSPSLQACLKPRITKAVDKSTNQPAAEGGLISQSKSAHPSSQFLFHLHTFSIPVPARYSSTTLHPIQRSRTHSFLKDQRQENPQLSSLILQMEIFPERESTFSKVTQQYSKCQI